MTQARAQATHVSIDASTVTDPAAFQKFQQAQDQLSGVLGHLLSITENYPDLKSNQNFLALQSQLEGTENRIEIARRDYNAAVQDYNTELRTFPGVIWATTLYKSQKPAQEFAASTAAQGAPVVNFTGQPQRHHDPAAAAAGQSLDAVYRGPDCVSVSGAAGQTAAPKFPALDRPGGGRRPCPVGPDQKRSRPESWRRWKRRPRASWWW